jgi:hypothetical protein
VWESSDLQACLEAVMEHGSRAALEPRRFLTDEAAAVFWLLAGEARAEAWRHLSVHGAVMSLQELIARARLMAHSGARDLVENVDIVADLLRVTRNSYPDKEKSVFDALLAWGSGAYVSFSGAPTAKEEEERDLAYEIASTLPRGSLEREYYQTLGASIQARMRFMYDDHSYRSDGREW